MIPCVEEAGHFEATLASVLQNRPPDCEILVIQPRSYDDPYQLRDEVEFLEAPGGSTLIELINIGIARSRGSVIHLLSCDVEVQEGWVGPALGHFDDPTVGAVSPLLVAKEADGRVIARGVCYHAGGARIVRRRAFSGRPRWAEPIVGPTLWAGLYRREALIEAGGLCTDFATRVVDVDLGMTLRRLGYRCVHEPSSVVTTECQGESPRLSFQEGRAAERLFWRHCSASDWIAILILHPWCWFVESLCRAYRPALLLQLLGRLRGWSERTRGREPKSLLDAAGELDCPQQDDSVRSPLVPGEHPPRAGRRVA
jgi:hypothetical protein